MSPRHVLATSSLLTTLVLTAGPAAAHTGPSADGFTAGFLHPLGGLDHVVAMIAVGTLAALVSGRAVWLIPLSFVAAMAAGGALGVTGVTLPGVESAIIASLIVLGALIAFARRTPAGLASVLAAAFAVFHGHAHGVEMAASACAVCYGAGFISATALLHALGVGIGLGAERLPRTAVRLGGGAVAALGLAFILV